MNNRALPIIVVIAIVLLLISMFYPIANDQEVKNLNPINEIQLTIPEPSGLYFDNITKTLWTVSDENSHVYNINREGNIIDSFRVDGFDLEGIVIIEDSILVTILERDRILLFLDRDGNEIKRVALNIKGEPNKGIEGITFSSDMDKFFVVNEKDPRILFVIDKSGNILSEFKLDFAKDFSGLNYEDKRLWIISDESSEIYLCSTEGKLIKRYKINIEQAEGLAIDKENSQIYVVSDPLEKLFVFSIP